MTWRNIWGPDNQCYGTLTALTDFHWILWLNISENQTPATSTEVHGGRRA